VKICLVSQEYPPETGGGGIGTQTYLKAQGLSARGHDVHVLSSSWDREARCYTDGKAVIHRIPEPQVPGAGYETSTYWLAYSAAVATKLHQLCQEHSFDIIQFPEYGGEGFVYQTDTFEQRTARFVVQLHGPLAMFVRHIGWPEPGSTLAEIGCFMERLAIHRSDMVLASSRATAQTCADAYGYPLERVRVIHSGIDVDRFSPEPDAGDDAFPRILFVGNFVGNKGFGLLVDVVTRLRSHFPHIRLRLIGKGDAKHVQQTLNKARDQGAGSNIELVGYAPYSDLPRHYAWCNFFAGPSSYEGGPGNVYLEAMACGRPVIACAVGGVPEVVLDRKTGLLIEPRSAIELESAITLLAEDECLRCELGANARDWVVENFSIGKYIDKVESHYRDVLSEPFSTTGAA
jgi:glycogen(starch) synthase